MIEPLSVGVHSVANLGKLKSNQSVVIFGCGPVGLLCMAVAKALGARRIVAVDINKERLEFAKAYAATDIYFPVGGLSCRLLTIRHLEEQTRTPMHMLQELPRNSAKNSPSLLLAGEPSTSQSMQQAHHLVFKWLFTFSDQRTFRFSNLLTCSGTFVAVGMGTKMTLPVPFFQIITKQLHVVGSYRYGTGDYEFAISLVERGLVDLKPLMTQQYEFTDALAAFEASKAGRAPDGKVGESRGDIADGLSL